LNLHEYFSYLVDDNIDKIDTFSPGHNIPVFSSKKLIQDKPDVVVILAWRFKEPILKKIPKYFSGIIVTPLPSFNIEVYGDESKIKKAGNGK